MSYYDQRDKIRGKYVKRNKGAIYLKEKNVSAGFNFMIRRNKKGKKERQVNKGKKSKRTEEKQKGNV